MNFIFVRPPSPPRPPPLVGGVIAAMSPPLHLWHGHSSFFISTGISVFYFSCNPLHPSPPAPPLFSSPPSPPPPSVHLVSRLSPPSPSPSSLCILDHFLSFQVSGPVEADNPSPGGAGPPHCLRSISLSLCSRYAHSPHPFGVGGRGRGAGRPQARRGGHLLQQQTLMMLLVLFTLQISHTHTSSTKTHTHLFNTHTRTPQHTAVQTALNRQPTQHMIYIQRAEANIAEWQAGGQASLRESEEGRTRDEGVFWGVQCGP